MNCREFTEFLMAWVDGELPPAAAADFDKHIALCPPCGQYLDSYRATVRMGRALCEDEAGPPPDDPPQELVDAILAARRKMQEGGSG